MLPLTELLSQVLVALTIELDNEYEHRVPSFTSDFKVSARGAGPWLVSYAMHALFLQFVPDDGITMRELSAKSGSDEPVHGAYHGMRRWGYVTYSPDISGSSPKASDGDAIVRPTPAGAHARDTWVETMADVEGRWGQRSLAPLHRSLLPIRENIDRALPEYVPIIGFDGRIPRLDRPVSRDATSIGLLGLLAQVYAAIALDFEDVSPLALSTTHGFMHGLSDEPIRVADLTDVTGIAKKAWSSATGQFEKLGLVALEPLKGGRGKAIRLTDKGVAAKETADQQLAEVEAEWRSANGVPLDRLREELEKNVGDGSPGSPLFVALEPYPDCWRAKVKPPKVMPSAPIVSHRGGYPDGA